MKEDIVKRDYFWAVEAVDRGGRVVYSGTFKTFDQAWDKYYSFKYYSFKGKNTVTLRRRYKEYKLA